MWLGLNCVENENVQWLQGCLNAERKGVKCGIQFEILLEVYVGESFTLTITLTAIPWMLFM